MTNILLVEDDLHIAMYGQHILEIAGYNVTLAPDGVAALEQIRSSCPDLIITDHEMPRMNGVELIRATRRAGILVPIILVSGTPEQHVSDGRDIGHDSYLSKPFQFDVFLEQVHAQLKRGRKAQPSGTA